MEVEGVCRVWGRHTGERGLAVTEWLTEGRMEDTQLWRSNTRPPLSMEQVEAKRLPCEGRAQCWKPLLRGNFKEWISWGFLSSVLWIGTLMWLWQDKDFKWAHVPVPVPPGRYDNRRILLSAWGQDRLWMKFSFLTGLSGQGYPKMYLLYSCRGRGRRNMAQIKE